VLTVDILRKESLTNKRRIRRDIRERVREEEKREF